MSTHHDYRRLPRPREWFVDIIECVAMTCGRALVLIGMALVLGVLIFGWIP